MNSNQPIHRYRHCPPDHLQQLAYHVEILPDSRELAAGIVKGPSPWGTPFSDVDPTTQKAFSAAQDIKKALSVGPY